LINACVRKIWRFWYCWSHTVLFELFGIFWEWNWSLNWFELCSYICLAAVLLISFEFKVFWRFQCSKMFYYFLCMKILKTSYVLINYAFFCDDFWKTKNICMCMYQVMFMCWLFGVWDDMVASSLTFLWLIPWCLVSNWC
jgi:hypothetical protein